VCDLHCVERQLTFTLGYSRCDTNPEIRPVLTLIDSILQPHQLSTIGSHCLRRNQMAYEVNHQQASDHSLPDIMGQPASKIITLAARIQSNAI
jgi:hypothetical protein